MSGLGPLLGFTVALLVVGVTFIIIDTGFTIATYNKDTDALTRTRIFINGTSCYAGEARRKAAYRVRELAAYEEYALPVPCHVDNGDEALYPANRLGSFSKGLQHDSLGIVNPTSYAIFLQAVTSGSAAHFDLIPTSGTLKLTSPQSGLAFNLVGGDTHSFYQAPSPALASRAFAHELAENYWMALCRDVPFADYGTDSQTLAAAAELSTFSEYGGPLPTIAATNLFRGKEPGCATGPYISQFLYGPCWFGANQIDMRLSPPTSGVNFMTTWAEFLSIQNGNAPSGTLTYGPTPRYIITGRDLSHWVHIDVLHQAYFQALLMLMKIGAPVKTSIPYQTSSLNQMGFATFGGPAIAQILTEVSSVALKSVWYQKWMVHRKLRPEAAGGRVDRTKGLLATFPLHPDILNSVAVSAMQTATGSWLLSQAFPEGSPAHPSYGAGHATVAGACTTILKFWFQEDYVLPNPVVPSANGTVLLPFVGPDLTVGGELNKVASNVALGRNIAGVHWRSDAQASLRLGEQVAVSFLRNLKKSFNEPIGQWTATSFDGTLLVV